MGLALGLVALATHATLNMRPCIMSSGSIEIHRPDTYRALFGREQEDDDLTAVRPASRMVGVSRAVDGGS